MPISQEKLNVRREVDGFFRKTAHEENAKNQKSSLEDILDKDDYGKRILFCIPESAGDVFLNTSLFQSLKQQYPWANLYVATKPEFFELLEGDPYVFKVIPFIPELENQLAMEGHGEHKGYFEIAFYPHYGVQRNLDYLHNAKTCIAFNNKY